MKIVPLDADELRVILPGARLFFAEGALPGRLNEEHFMASFASFIKADLGVVLAAFGPDQSFWGAIAGVAFPDVATGDLTANELFWFVLPEHRKCGIKLLAAFEEEMRRRGCIRIHMVHLYNQSGEKLDRFYERKGYRPLEIAFTKELLPSNTG